MKTLEDFKNEVAKEQGYENWKYLLFRYKNALLAGASAALVEVEYHFDAASNRYANYIVEEQMKVCAEHACFRVEDFDFNTGERSLVSKKQIAWIDEKSNWHYEIDKSSILNCPNVVKSK